MRRRPSAAEAAATRSAHEIERARLIGELQPGRIVALTKDWGTTCHAKVVEMATTSSFMVVLELLHDGRRFTVPARDAERALVFRAAAA